MLQLAPLQGNRYRKCSTFDGRIWFRVRNNVFSYLSAQKIHISFLLQSEHSHSTNTQDIVKFTHVCTYCRTKTVRLIFLEEQQRNEASLQTVAEAR